MGEVTVPQLEGQTIEEVRRLTDEELEEANVSHWKRCRGPNPVGIMTEGGSIVFPSSDPEGNSPGVLFGEYSGNGYYVGPENE